MGVESESDTSGAECSESSSSTWVAQSGLGAFLGNWRSLALSWPLSYEGVGEEIAANTPPVPSFLLDSQREA